MLQIPMHTGVHLGSVCKAPLTAELKYFDLDQGPLEVLLILIKPAS